MDLFKFAVGLGNISSKEMIWLWNLLGRSVVLMEG